MQQSLFSTGAFTFMIPNCYRRMEVTQFNLLVDIVCLFRQIFYFMLYLCSHHASICTLFGINFGKGCRRSCSNDLVGLERAISLDFSHSSFSTMHGWAFCKQRIMYDDSIGLVNISITALGISNLAGRFSYWAHFTCCIILCPLTLGLRIK